MRQENVRNKVFYSGMGHQYDIGIQENIEQGLDEFKLKGEHIIEETKVNVTLSFNKGEKDYFFNSFELEFINKQGELLKYTFHIDNKFYQEAVKAYPELSLNFTLKEAFNYMEGRYVYKLHQNKAKEIYPAWKARIKGEDGKYHHKVFSEGYGFNLEAVLSKEQINELKTEESASNLYKSFKRGNVTTGTYSSQGREYERKLVLDVERKVVNIINPHKLVDKNQGKEISAGSTRKIAESETIDKGDSDEESPSGRRNTQRRNRSSRRSQDNAEEKPAKQRGKSLQK